MQLSFNSNLSIVKIVTEIFKILILNNPSWFAFRIHLRLTLGVILFDIFNICIVIIYSVEVYFFLLQD